EGEVAVGVAVEVAAVVPPPLPQPASARPMLVAKANNVPLSLLFIIISFRLLLRYSAVAFTYGKGGPMILNVSPPKGLPILNTIAKDVISVRDEYPSAHFLGLYEKKAGTEYLCDISATRLSR
ncbi:MAG TPA: hypothetical protein VF795_05615, partial [Desulfuromonadaceae bacterium]